MMALVASFLFLGINSVPKGSMVDTDNDGLLDRWEIEGFGPLKPDMGCKPDRADIIIVFRMSFGMKQETIQPTIDRMKQFYASMPYKNKDGSSGLNLIAIVPPALPKETEGKGYIELYEQGMPVEWRGLAHGILVGNSPGGGGQANRPDWCGTGYNWHTMLHEVGHQLGLPHEPLGAKTGSPFHRSMMNYDYSYQLDGKSEDIIFSDGKFLPIRMKETNLNETVPFSIKDLKFLANRPYFFKLEKVSDKVTRIDWNRNGVLGEKNVRANVNDGYAVELRSNVRIERSAGAPALASLGKTLAVFYPDHDEVGYKGYDKRALSSEQPGRLSVQLFQAGKASPQQVLVKQGVTGDVSAVSSKGQFYAAYPTNYGFSYSSYKVQNEQLLRTGEGSYSIKRLEPVLIEGPNGVLAVAWDPETKQVRIGSLTNFEKDSSLLPGVTSQHAPGAVWNPKRKQLAIVPVVRQANLDGCMKIIHFTPEGTSWKEADSVWVGDDKGLSARTSNRPILILDSSKDGGPKGMYTVYVKGDYPDPHQPGINFSCRQVAEGTGWRIKMMGNEWAASRCVCGVTHYKGDVAYAYRWHGGDQDHKIFVTERASGIEDEYLTDFDEVTFIFEHGLKNSLNAVRQEQWKRKRP